jgi:hypothetical protein
MPAKKTAATTSRRQPLVEKAPKLAGNTRAQGAGSGGRRLPTMQDIADASGVSQSTVSRVLTGAPNAIPINPATRE